MHLRINVAIAVALFSGYRGCAYSGVPERVPDTTKGGNVEPHSYESGVQYEQRKREEDDAAAVGVALPPPPRRLEYDPGLPTNVGMICVNLACGHLNSARAMMEALSAASIGCVLREP